MYLPTQSRPPFRFLIPLLFIGFLTPLPLQAEAKSPAQEAFAMKGILYNSGVGFGKWIDRAGDAIRSAFLNSFAYGQTTWMRLLSAILILAIAGFLSWLLTRVIQRRSGNLQSDEHQSWWQIGLSALRKPLALIGWLTGGFFSVSLLIDRVHDPITRADLFNVVTSLAYAGRVIIIFWLLFRLLTGVKKRIRHWAESRGGVLESVLLPIIAQALRIIVPLIAFTLLLPLMNFPEDWAWVTRKITGMLIIGGLSYLIIRAANLSEKALLRAHRLDVPDNLEARKIYTKVSVARKIVVVCVTVVGTAGILMLFDPLRRFGASILASAGIAGIVLGFAAQRTLGNLLAGIQIALTQPIRIDDVVIVEGEWGKIEEINLTYVVICIWDLRRLVVPITYFVEKPFQNWTRTTANLLGTIFLYVDYTVPVEEVRKELRRLCEENRASGLWDGAVCGLQVTDTKDKVLELRCLASSPDAPKGFDLRCILREKLILFLRENYPGSLPKMRAELYQTPSKAKRKSPKTRIRPIGEDLPGLKPINQSDTQKMKKIPRRRS